MLRKYLARSKNALVVPAVLAALFFSAACSTAKSLPPDSISQIQENSGPEEFSRGSVIVYLKNGTGLQEINALAERHGLNVLYIYKNFSACALSSESTLSAAALDSLISDIEKERCVLGVQKDYIMKLD